MKHVLQLLITASSIYKEFASSLNSNDISTNHAVEIWHLGNAGACVLVVALTHAMCWQSFLG
jgi:hypothetical protein